jgi:hypothetical protein
MGNVATGPAGLPYKIGGKTPKRKIGKLFVFEVLQQKRDGQGTNFCGFSSGKKESEFVLANRSIVRTLRPLILDCLRVPASGGWGV